MRYKEYRNKSESRASDVEYNFFLQRAAISSVANASVCRPVRFESARYVIGEKPIGNAFPEMERL